MNRYIFAALFLYFGIYQTVQTMENPKDDVHDQEMTDIPTTGTRTTSSSASSKSVSRVPTLLESINSNTGSIISSHRQLPALHRSSAVEVFEKQAQLFETDVESVMNFYVENKTISPEEGALQKNLVHIQGKMLLGTLMAVNHGIIFDSHGSKGLYDFLGAEYEDPSLISNIEEGKGTFRPPALKNSYKETIIQPITRELNITRKQLCCWVVGGAVTNALLAVGAFTALYLK